MKSALEVNEVKTNYPILIVDKVGILGEALAEELSKDFQILLMSGSHLNKNNKQIIHATFKKRIPKVPAYRYSKIFLIDDGESVTRESAFSFIKLARENNAPLFFIGSIRNVDIKHADSIASEYSNSKVLIFGDLFDKNIFFDKDLSISKYILESRKNGRIEVEGSGLNISYPMSFDDTIKLILKAVYLNISQKVILLFYPHPYSDITLANIFQKVNPNIKVDFIKEKKTKKIYFPNNSQHAIGKYDLENKIRNLDLEDSQNREIKVIKRERGYKNGIIKPTLFILVTFLFLLLLPFLTTSIYAFLGNREISGAVKSFENGDIPKAKKQIKNADSFYDTALKTADPLVAEASIFGFEKDASEIKKNIATGKEITEASSEFLDGAEIIANIVSQKSTDPKNDFNKANSSIKNSISVFSKVKAEGGLPEEIDSKLENMDPFISLFVNSSEALPEVLGFEKEKKYLVLMQNNNELRPSGGVIENVGMLTIETGKVKSFEIKNSDELDNSIIIDSEPPFEIRRYVPQKSLLLKDSGYDTDFVKSAINISNAYERVSREKVDGAIAVDINFLKNILLVTGEIKVSGERISGENISEKLTDKKSDYYQELIKQVLIEIGKEKYSPVLFGESIGKSIQSKDVAFAFVDPGLQNIFTVNGWSSSLWDERSKADEMVNDYFGLSESNLGRNNSNYFISRSVSKKVLVGENGRVSSVAEIVFKNSSLKMNYKNYLRLILPEGSVINKILIDDVEQNIVNPVTDFKVYESVNFKPSSGLEIFETKQMGKSLFGIFLNIPSNSIKTLDIDYDLPYSVDGNQKQFVYSIKVFKQPGVAVYPMNLSFSLPKNYFFPSGKTNYLLDINSDKELNLDISQK